MIDPKTVLLSMPAYSGQNMTELTGMLVTCRDLYGGITAPTECSHPSLVRNIIADIFLRSPFQWLVGVDSDIVFQRADLELLLEEIDPSMQPAGTETVVNGVAVPTRIVARCVDSPALPATFDLPTDALVCAEYAYKKEPFEAVRFGCGFYRVHRHVFEVLQELKHEDDGRVTVDRAQLARLIGDVQAYLNADGIGPDSLPLPTDINSLMEELMRDSTCIANTPRLWQAHHNGRTFWDYYPSGPLITQHVPAGDWKGEDHGFWTLCHLAGLIPRIERRTRVLHIGRKGYPYEPDQEITQ